MTARAVAVVIIPATIARRSRATLEASRIGKGPIRSPALRPPSASLCSLLTAGMHRHGYDLQLTQYDDRGWRATFYVSGVEHSPVAATGTAWEATAWRAVQRAAWRALVRVQDGKQRDRARGRG